MRIAGLIQARMGSTRLPGKVMLPICGKPLVGHVIDRLEAVAGLNDIVLATTADPRNEPLVAYARERGLVVHREEAEDDIAARLAGAARAVDADAVLKINSDCPLADVAVLQRLVDVFRRAGDADYVSNKIEWTYPEGLSAEVIATRALEWCDANLADPRCRELVANWIRDHGERFKTVSVTGDEDLSHHGWVVDTPEDFEFVTHVFEALYRDGELFGLHDILAFLARKDAAAQ